MGNLKFHKYMSTQHIHRFSGVRGLWNFWRISPEVKSRGTQSTSLSFRLTVRCPGGSGGASRQIGELQARGFKLIEVV